MFTTKNNITPFGKYKYNKDSIIRTSIIQNPNFPKSQPRTDSVRTFLVFTFFKQMNLKKYYYMNLIERQSLNNAWNKILKQGKKF